MKKISKPDITQKDICNSFKNLNFKERILEKSKEYDQDIYNIRHFLEEENEFEKSHTGFQQYMKNTYNNRFTSNQKSYVSSYALYKKIRSHVTTCPYCNYLTRSVKQLDHYLPKSVYSTYAITVNNLVPICKECNENKGDYSPIDKRKMIIHPYYDDLANDINRFLKCRVVEDFNIGFEFYIVKLDEWDEDTYERVKLHFELLELNKLYDADFAGDFADFMEYMTEILDMHEVMSKEIVHKLFKKKVTSLEKKNIKPWSLSGFKGALESDWFMNTYIPWKCNLEDVKSGEF